MITNTAVIISVLAGFQVATCTAAQPATAVAESAAPAVTLKDGVIRCFPDGVKDGRVIHSQIDGQKLWVDATLRGDKLRQVRITCYVGNGGTITPVNLYCPEVADGSMSWNLPVKREGDTVSVNIPWNGVLIGDFMYVNEGGDDAASIRKRLGVESGTDSSMPVMVSSGDSISLGYWPYLEAALGLEVNVYYQREVVKDLPSVPLSNNGHAHLAYLFLEKAYQDPRFKPQYVLMNFGLHMIATHSGKIDEYGQWIEKMDDLTKKHGTQLIWVTTTPYDQSQRPAQNQTILKFNETAKAVAAKRAIPVVDLHACVLDAIKELGANNVHEDGVHFRDEVKKRQGEFIAARVREITRKPNRP